MLYLGLSSRMHSTHNTGAHERETSKHEETLYGIMLLIAVGRIMAGVFVSPPRH